MYADNSIARIHHFDEDDGRHAQPKQTVLALPGFYADLMQKYPRAFELQLRAQQQQQHQHQTADPSPAHAVSSEHSRLSSASGSNSKDELSHIIETLARSLAHRRRGALLSVGSSEGSEETTRTAVPDVYTRVEFAPPNSHHTANVNTDLRARLQRNKEVMQQLLGHGSPFNSSPGVQREYRESQRELPLHRSSYDGAESLWPSTKRLPRTRLPPPKTSVDVCSDKPGGRDKDIYSVSNVSPREGIGSPHLNGSSSIEHTSHKQQELTEPHHNADDSCYRGRTAPRSDRFVSVHHQGLTQGDNSLSEAAAAASSLNQSPADGKRDSVHPVPKLKKSKSAKEHGSIDKRNAAEGSSVPGTKSKGQSILRCTDSFSGSSSRSGRVRFSETPDTIDETEPRLAQLKWLSESSVFEGDVFDADSDTKKGNWEPGSGSCRRRARQSAVMRSLTDLSAPPKPLRVHQHIGQAESSVPTIACDHMENSPSGGTISDDMSESNDDIPVSGVHERSATSHGGESQHHNYPSDYDSSDGLAREQLNTRCDSNAIHSELYGGSASADERAPQVSPPKAKASRRTKLAASDFEPAYTIATAVGDSIGHLTKPPLNDKVLASHLLHNEERQTGTQQPATIPSLDTAADDRKRLEPQPTARDTRRQAAVSVTIRNKKSDVPNHSKTAVDIPGSIVDDRTEAQHDVCDQDDGVEDQLEVDLEEAAGIAADRESHQPPAQPSLPIYDLDDHTEPIGTEATEAAGDKGAHSSARISRASLKPLHGNLSGSQLSLSERMGSLKRAARGAIKTLRRAMSLERLSRNSRTITGADDSTARDSSTVSQVASAKAISKPPSQLSCDDQMPKVKKSLSLRSLGKLSFKKRASYSLNSDRAASPAAAGQQGSYGSIPMRIAAGSTAVGSHWHHAENGADKSGLIRLDTSVDQPKNFRAIGKLLELHQDGTRTVRLQRPPHGPFGFYVNRLSTSGLAGTRAAVSVTRLSDSYPEKMFAGLLGIGDELLEVNGRPVDQLSLDDIHDIMATTVDSLLLLVRPACARESSR